MTLFLVVKMYNLEKLCNNESHMHLLKIVQLVIRGHTFHDDKDVNW